MTEAKSASVPLYYLGPPGPGLGFQLAGINAVSCTTPDALLEQLRQFVQRFPESILYVDEELAAAVLDEVEALNAKVLPAIVLVTTPAAQQHVAARKLQRLLLRAAGSDIFGS